MLPCSSGMTSRHLMKLGRKVVVPEHKKISKHLLFPKIVIEDGTDGGDFPPPKENNMTLPETQIWVLLAIVLKLATKTTFSSYVSVL